MFGWFKKQHRSPLASIRERETILSAYHPIFRVIDTDFHIYLDIVVDNPAWDDDQIEQALCARGVSADFAQELVCFIPLAFGRELVEQLGVKCNELYLLHNLVDESECKLPLANEPAYAWARAMIQLYRTAERNETFMMVARRSAELDAVNNALHSGITQEELREAVMAPSVVSIRRPVRKAATDV